MSANTQETGSTKRAGKPKPAPDGFVKETAAEKAEGGSPDRNYAKRTAENVLGANPVVGLDGREIVNAIKKLVQMLAVRPDVIVKEEFHFVRELVKVLAGSSGVTPDPKDRRFKHEIWHQNGFYKRVMQAYLAWRSSLQNMIESTRASELDKERARFALALFTEALAPTNTIVGNPGALMRIVQTKGRSLLYGAQNMLEDFMSNGGMPKQVDDTKFRVGKNLATSPGAVIFRSPVCEVIQYAPATKQVHARPVLVVPPQINKFYVLDLAPGRSFAEYATRHGVQLFSISWRNPTAVNRDWNLETYIEACIQALDAVKSITKSPDVHVLAACAGGYTLANLMGHLAATGDPSVHSATFMVTVLDTQCPTMMSMFSSKSGIAAAIRRSRSKGVLEGQDMARVFSWLRPNDLVWGYVANNWVMGNRPPAFDVLYWNADTTRLPAEFHADMLSHFLHNPLTKPGRLRVLGTDIDMSKVKTDAFVLAGITDHITPWEACFETRKILGGKIDFVLSSSGHIQSIVNPPGNPKARFYTNQNLALDPEDWLERSDEHTGSWWDYWLTWFTERAGKKKAAPEKLGNANYPPGDKAPGRYVHQR